MFSQRKKIMRREYRELSPAARIDRFVHLQKQSPSVVLPRQEEVFKTKLSPACGQETK